MIEEDSLFAQYAGYGFTKRGFRLWMNAMGVPWMLMPNQQRLYWLECVQLAIAHVMGMGQLNFVCPSDDTVVRGQRPRANTRTSVLHEDMKRRWRDAVGELLLARKVDYAPKHLVDHETRQEFDRVAEAIITSLANCSVKGVVRVRNRARKMVDQELKNNGEAQAEQEWQGHGAGEEDQP